HLDLYVGTYKTRNVLDVYPPQLRAFDQTVKKIGDKYVIVDQWKKDYRIEDHPELGGIVRSQRAERDLFFLNDGAGHFTRVPLASPRFLDVNGKPLVEEPDYFTLAARFYDVNGDGTPDLYVCNDFEDPDQFWLNDGKGHFRLAPPLALRETSNTCMSVDFGDINRDEHVDLFTADMMGPTLAARQREFPTNTPLPKLGGLPTDRQQWTSNMLQLSRGDGTWASIQDFAGVSGTDWTWGSAFVDADLDGDGDMDVIATRLDATPMLYRNETSASRIAVRLAGKTPNDQGIGAKVSVIARSLPKQTREMTAGGYYLSGSDAELTFATG